MGAGEALAAARRLGASAALVAEAIGNEWQWTLYQSAAGAPSVRFQGDVSSGVEGAADTLALGSQAMSLQPISEVELIVTGVSDLMTHGAVRRALGNRVAIKNVDLLEVGSTSLRFRVQVSGGQRGLVSSLESDSSWQRELVNGPQSSGPLRYRFVVQDGPRS